ncbi:hypothetical protein [Crateriforma spongiae]|uniref:hypothetical protein n=1 Tax=Crateriforma spongiae TaxID=2724528 RepID=UPI001980E969|nr:hypothetical protein [Crateriforma spongiae]
MQQWPRLDIFEVVSRLRGPAEPYRYPNKLMGRLHQDRDFTVDAVAGSLLLDLIAISDESNKAKHPIVFYAKFSRTPGWHRVFLDLGAAFLGSGLSRKRGRGTTR